MKRILPWVSLAPLALGLAMPNKQAQPDDKTERALKLIQEYCLPCHNADPAMMGVSFEGLDTIEEARQSQELLARAAAMISESLMPPALADAPTDEERQTMLDGIYALEEPETGHVSMRRLNSAEYSNTVRDLLGVELGLAKEFPSDGVANGFDNMAAVLTLSPLLFEKYMDAAEQIAAAAIWVPDRRESTIPAIDIPAGNGMRHTGQDTLRLTTSATAEVNIHAPRTGDYKLSLRAFGDQAGPELVKIALFVDGRKLTEFEVAATVAAPGEYAIPTELREGTHRVGVAFLNDYYKPDHPDPAQRDRNLVLLSIELDGPFNSPPLTTAHRWLIPIRPDETKEMEAARKIAEHFAYRAYRRPPLQTEVDALLGLYKTARDLGLPYEGGVRTMVQGALTSPSFLYRTELDSRGQPTQYGLASRLSYFLWSSMPDDALFALAEKGEMDDPETLERQMLRMIADPKAAAFANNFAEQWLQLRRLDEHQPDPELFPAWSDELRGHMMAESKALFRYVFEQNRPLTELIDCDYAFLNGPLARHYGLPEIYGSTIRKVELPGERRGGLITQAAILTLTSNPNRTSPVKRGKWVLEVMLGTPPPPPPPGVDSLPDEAEAPRAMTLRQKMELHRRDPACASCHSKLDPLGFALENYNAVGAWRDTEAGAPIDSSGKLPTGETFEGSAGLRELLLERKDRFVEHLAEQLMIYALGRGLEPAELKEIEKIAARVADDDDYKAHTLLREVVASDLFRGIE